MTQHGAWKRLKYDLLSVHQLANRVNGTFEHWDTKVKNLMWKHWHEILREIFFADSKIISLRI